MRKYFLAIAPAILLAIACNAPNPGTSSVPINDTNSQSTANIPTTRGKEVFRQRCIYCHGLNGNYRNNNAANLRFTRLDSIGIIQTIQNGKGAMPMFDHSIPDSDLAQLELYVKSLRE